jgi:hypothetical protein
MLMTGAAILFWAAQLASGGTITGTIRLPAGTPAAGVRVVAVAVPDTPQRAAESTVFESITQTDSSGRYRLENLSPGRYYVAAGLVGVQTFYPGTPTQSAASVIAVTRDSPLLTGVNFMLNNAMPTAAQGLLPQAAQAGGLVCCRLKGNFVMEDKSIVPDFPREIRAVNRRGSPSLNGFSVWKSLGYFPFTIPIHSTAEIAVEGLPAGYVLKSVAYGGKDVGLNPFLIDGKALGTLDLILGYDPAGFQQKVAARGKVINPAAELKVTGIRLVSTIPKGPVLLAGLEPDGSFEFKDIPIGLYRVGVIDPKGGENTSPKIFEIGAATASLTVDLRNNPFPEFDGVPPARHAFTDGKITEITGVITQKVTRIVGGRGYFRLNVKDASTGVISPWAVLFEHEWQIPKITVGETITVPGVASTDGTNRFSAFPF